MPFRVHSPQADTFQKHALKTLKLLRKNRGYSIRHLADLSGVSNSTICVLENGKGNLTLSTLYLIVSALDCTMKTFFYNVEKQIAGEEARGKAKSNNPDRYFEGVRC